MGCTSSNTTDVGITKLAKNKPVWLPQADREIIKKVLDFWFGKEEQPDWDRNSPPAWGAKWF